MTDLEKLFNDMTRPSVRGAEPYDAGTVPAGCVRVNANENNLGVSPLALAAMKKALDEGNRYPESSCAVLRQKLAARYGLTPEHILVSNGLDGMFTMMSRAFMDKGDEIICGALTFSIYEDNARIMDAVPVIPDMTDGLGFDVRSFAAAVTERTKMIFFCNPNNPTGTMVGESDIRWLLDTVPHSVIVVLDEAYIDFADDPHEYSFRLLAEHPNLIVVRTFSKIYGLAGVRVGWAAAHPGLLSVLKRVREPFGVTELAFMGAAAALDDTEFYEKSRELFISERRSLCRFLDEKKIPYVPSQGNFVLLPLGDNSASLAEEFARAGIIVRRLTFKGVGMLRVSIGLPDENERIKAVLSKIPALR